MKKKILFITGSRSEYYIQKPILNELKKSKFLKPLLIVTGSHFSKKFGNTYKDILKDNFKISAKINNLYVSDKFSSRLESMSLLLTQLTKYVKKIRPDCLVAPYDREESIAMAIVNSPKLILADEPTSSLDDENCERVIKLLKKQASDFNAQLIVITHDNRLKKHFKKSIKL